MIDKVMLLTWICMWMRMRVKIKDKNRESLMRKKKTPVQHMDTQSFGLEARCAPPLHQGVSGSSFYTFTGWFWSQPWLGLHCTLQSSGEEVPSLFGIKSKTKHRNYYELQYNSGHSCLHSFLKCQHPCPRPNTQGPINWTTTLQSRCCFSLGLTWGLKLWEVKKLVQPSLT